MQLKFRNVNDALTGLVTLFHERYLSNDGYGYQPEILEETSRNGKVLRVAEPVTVTYTHPTERVLFNEGRDANPFALLYEALWMLAGRNDVAALAYYTPKFKDYSDDGRTLNGAYGYRWRHHQPKTVYTGHTTGYNGPPDDGGTDQLDLLVQHLKDQPNSRRAVLTMWTVEDDLLKIGGNGSMASLDTCCNLNVMLSLRTQPRHVEPTRVWKDGLEVGHGTDTVYDTALDITVTNRSNDLAWGLLGANYVTFSVLQEYLAARLGVAVGRYHHFTNNLHVYDWNFKPEEWLSSRNVRNPYQSMDEFNSAWARHPAGDRPFSQIPLVADPDRFEVELPVFVQNHASPDPSSVQTAYQEPFLRDVADPLLKVFHSRKAPGWDHWRKWAKLIKADDWRIAATSWVERREERARAKDEAKGG